MESVASTAEYQELEQKHARHLNMMQENVSVPPAWLNPSAPGSQSPKTGPSGIQQNDGQDQSQRPNTWVLLPGKACEATCDFAWRLDREE